MIIPSQTITGNLARLIEFPDEYSINGTLYKKDTMENTGKFLLVPALSTTHQEIVIDRFVTLVDNYYERYQASNSYFLDSNDQNTMWLIHNNHNTGENVCGFRKFKKINGEWTETNYISWNTANNNRYLLNPVTQDSRFIYFYSDAWRDGDSNAYVMSYLGRLNKITLGLEYSAQSTATVHGEDIIFFHETNDRLYYFRAMANDATNWNSLLWCTKDAWSASFYYNTSYDSNIFPNFGYSISSTLKGPVQAPCASFNPGGVFYLTVEPNSTKKEGMLTVWELKLNENTMKFFDQVTKFQIVGPKELVEQTNICSLDTTTADWSGLGNQLHRVETIEDNGKQYLIYVTTARARQTNVPPSPKYWKIMVFEVQGEQLEIKSVTRISQPMQLCTSYDSKQFLFGHYDGCYLYRWESGSESFVLGNTWRNHGSGVVPYQFGFDRDGRVIIKWSDQSLEIDNVNQVESCKVEFLGAPDKATFPHVATLKITFENTEQIAMPPYLKIYLKGCKFEDGEVTQIVDAASPVELPVVFDKPATYSAAVYPSWRNN